jgi:hypothetical protein
MEKDEVVMIPYVAHESSMNRMERANKRLWIVILVMFIAFMIYLLLPASVSTDTQTVDNANNSEVNQTIGE